MLGPEIVPSWLYSCLQRQHGSDNHGDEPLFLMLQRRATILWKLWLSSHPIRPTSYEWMFVPEAGKTFSDSGSAVCH
jgi:hypothetical protein